MNPRANQVTATNDYKLRLVFTNGEQSVFDCTNLLNLGVFKELKNKFSSNKQR
jgi:hypothetical protein